MITKEDVIDICKQIDDPEIAIDIYTLGLIYDISVSDDGGISILMTYTTPLCPFGERMKIQLVEALQVLHPKSVEIEVTFQPKWEASQELRDLLGV